MLLLLNNEMKFREYLLHELVKTDLNNISRLREIRIQAQHLLKADELRKELNEVIQSDGLDSSKALELSERLDEYIAKIQEFKYKEFNKERIIMVGKKLTLAEKKILTREGLDAKRYRRLKDYGRTILVINIDTHEQMEVKKDA